MLLAVDVVAAVMLEDPVVNRAVMGWIGTASASPTQILAQSKALFSLAIADGAGFAPDRREHALEALPAQITFGFRGVLSFWTAGEVPDEQLATSARAFTQALMLGYADPGRWPVGS